jgi:hypothetical protein
LGSEGSAFGGRGMLSGCGGTVIYDDRGRAWRVGDPALSRWLGTARADAFAPQDLVRNLGFVVLTERPRALEVRLRPATVSQKALAAALYEVHDWAPARLTLVADDAGQRHDLFVSIPQFQHAVDTLLAQSQIETRRFIKRRVALDTLDGGSLLRAMSHRWAADCVRSVQSQAQTKQAICDLGNAHLNGRIWVMAAIPAQGRVLVDDLGFGFRVPNPSAFRHLIGNSVADHPDVAYGRWLANSFRQVQQDDVPCVEEVDCLIDWPDAGQQRHRYRRLVLPFKQSDGTCALVGATVTDVSFDLRCEPLREVS